MGLYQARAGAFFKVVVNHDGEEVLEFGPVSDHEAQKLLEKHANHLVEKYFDVIEDGSAERRFQSIWHVESKKPQKRRTPQSMLT
ncbi:hypothetical protein XI09_05305 [Bradyrhizobium sp. CCBAU 11386]|uniref:hypothetical protein n=1 Tax=Bradyrhizobium sp. CCBAU 11386 TaxID=1630837 RepID=UPI002303B679|nr:hypothetical protein [Bradyrhizobium sp. CCBAU 11386]MDA9504187.1 hypothetical protein [Bradyrhizobium sp. CCBAU 11386]